MTKQKQLLAYFSADFEEADVIAVHELVERLDADDKWTVAPPVFVNEIDDSSCTRPEDEPIRMVGLLLWLTSEGSGRVAPKRDLVALVDAIAKFSQEHGVEFELQLDDDYAGTIENGVPDERVRKGLLEAWEPTDFIRPPN